MSKFFLNHEKPIDNKKEDSFIIKFQLEHGSDGMTSEEQISVPLKFRYEIEKFVLDIEGRESTPMNDYNSFYDDPDYYISNFCIAYEKIDDILEDESTELSECISEHDLDLDDIVGKYKGETKIYLSILNGEIYTQKDYELAKYVRYSPDTDITNNDNYAGCHSVVVLEIEDNKYYAVYSTS